MKYGALLGWGIVIYAIVFLAWSCLVMYGFVEGVVPRIIGLGALIGTAAIATGTLRLMNWRDVMPYAVSWTVVVILMDAALSVPFAGFSIYRDINIWIGYALVFVTPIIYARVGAFRRRPPAA